MFSISIWSYEVFFLGVGGSYSGIFPSEPMFFSDTTLQEQGFDVLNGMFDFYAGLDSKLQASVVGMTLMNEPAHSMPQDGETMVRPTGFRPVCD